MRELSLEANRLSAPVIDLRSLAHLRSLQLFGNPLDFLPELTPCSSLRHLSLANVSSSCHLLIQICYCVFADCAALQACRPFSHWCSEASDSKVSLGFSLKLDLYDRLSGKAVMWFLAQLWS